MPELKLAKLPDRTPIKITISITPDLQAALHDYAKAYADTYGRDEPVTELIPAMLVSFIENDRAFMRSRAKP